jgi:putative lipoprotein
VKPPLLLALFALSLIPELVAAQATPAGIVTGTVTYKHRFALPPDAIVEVRLQDTSRADAAARTIGHVTVPSDGAQVPIPFRIEFDPAAIDPSHSYAVRANITVGGKLLFTSATMYPVLTRGAGNDATIVVYMILPEQAAPAPSASGGPPVTLEGTMWKLVVIGEAPANVPPATREANFTLHPGDHRLSGSGGCNRLIGKYEHDGDALKLSPGGTTMMACPDEMMQQESDFMSALKMTTGFRISGQTLELRNGDRILARFMAQTAR